MRGKRYILGLKSRLDAIIDIEVWEKGYSGPAIERKLSSAPILRLDHADSGVMGTSLELAIQSEVTEDLIDFYTVDNKKYLFKVFRDSVLIWSGFSLPEKYEEYYAAAPYPVSITVSDGLGVLKDIPFSHTGQSTLLGIIKYILDKTELLLPFHLFFNITTTGQNINHNTLYNTSVYADTYAGLSCYEALTAILNDINAFVRQKNGVWLIARYSDVTTNGWLYANDLSSVSRALLEVGVLSLEGECSPIGSLTMGIIPARKSCLFTFPYKLKPSFIANYNFANNLDGWTALGGTATQGIWRGQGWLKFSPSVEWVKTSLFVQATVQDMSLSFDYAMLQGADIEGAAAELALSLELDPGGAIKHYLTPNGWSTTEKYIIISYTNQKEINAEIQKFSVIFSGFPAPGTLTIHLRKTTFCAPYVTNVLLNVFAPKGQQIQALFAENASTLADDVTINFLDSPFTQNDTKILYNRLINATSKTWTEGSSGITTSYIKTIVRDYISHLAFPKRVLTGSMLTANCPDLLVDNITYYLKSYELNLQNEEAVVEYVQALGYNSAIDIPDPVPIDEYQSSTVPSAGTGSSGAGNLNSSSIGSIIAGSAEKKSPHNNDDFCYSDSQDGTKLKRITWADLKTAITAVMSAFFSTKDHNHNDIYAPASHDHNNSYASIYHSHSDATSVSSGFMNSIDKQKIDGATAINLGSTIVQRDSNGKIAVGSIEINGWTMTID